MSYDKLKTPFRMFIFVYSFCFMLSKLELMGQTNSMKTNLDFILFIALLSCQLVQGI